MIYSSLDAMVKYTPIYFREFQV